MAHYYGTPVYDMEFNKPAPWYQGRVACFLGGCVVAACVTMGVKSQMNTATENYAVTAVPSVAVPAASAVVNRRFAQPQPLNRAEVRRARFSNARPSSVALAAGEWAPSEKMPRKFIVGGNWKCNGDRASIKSLVSSLNEGDNLAGSGVEVVVAPPMLFGDYTRGMLRPDFGVAFQNCWVGGGGAFTGEVSADMIKDAGFDWVILGHSERRALPELMETDETVATKTAYALEAGLKVMLCIGEQLDERQSGKTDEVNARQLAAVADKITDWSNVVIAYEPVWAIGTGVVATPEQAQETHANIRKWMSDNVSPEVAKEIRIMYGGSANAGNAEALAVQPDVDGFLVGGASLKPEFLKVIDSWSKKLE
jgi:triosephosphate isomerase|eukprot:CAMPEP_0174288912 /NCGR_PEP_ID=MMETSP0809-20121228/22755_1 /TAXON_ID=73025 ORGANISM="Eutreptiella gymnastica-like, Strain CCMP1594" /NCGR_SAMPLE_ID=MMETSP0809 /ASSEMBLY_ACC=CAM_ASM_000658 /LENGTH=365 /DNA_ID=CAMNT_0015386479 /DNA_START=46 /DNA_END=1143 /DNA_ORIENTATION=-